MAQAPTTHVPPQNIEAEESVLGAMLVAEPTLTRVIDEVKLNAEDFYLDKHRLIFTCVHDLYAESKPVDELSVTEALTQRNQIEEAGGKHYVSELAAKVPAAGNAKHYAEIVQQNSLLRRLLGAGQRIQSWVHERDGEPRELSERAEKLLFDVAHKEQASDFRLLSEILHDEVDRLEKLSTGETELTGTPSGFRDIDAITGGFQPGNLIIVAARPAMGKSALVANIAENVAVKHNRPVAFFSLEMSEVELAQRFIACRARISGDKLRKGQVAQKDWPKVVRACNELEEAPLWFDDSSDLGILDLRAKARRLHAQEQDKGGLGLVIVDYLQLMRSDDHRANRVEQVGQMSRGLKILARELEVPVLAISQLSRAPEQRHPPKPLLSDLRESGQRWFQVYLAARERLTHGRRNPVASWLERAGGLRTAVLPKSACRRSSSPSQRGRSPRFLRHLWATDGSVWLGGPRQTANVYYATSSFRLAQDVQALLLRLGINGRLSRHDSPAKGRPQFHVTVSGGTELVRFLEIVGALGDQQVSPRERHLGAFRRQASQPESRCHPEGSLARHGRPGHGEVGMTSRRDAGRDWHQVLRNRSLQERDQQGEGDARSERGALRGIWSTLRSGTPIGMRITSIEARRCRRGL